MQVAEPYAVEPGGLKRDIAPFGRIGNVTYLDNVAPWLRLVKEAYRLVVLLPIQDQFRCLAKIVDGVKRFEGIGGVGKKVNRRVIGCF